MYFPRLKGKAASSSTVKRFYGYDHTGGCGEGSLYDSCNMTNELFPLLATRKPRGDVGAIENCQGLLDKDALIHVAGGTLYMNGSPTPLSGMREGEKQLVSMGAYVCVFPDKLYYNTADPTDYGSMEANWNYQGEVTLSLCDSQGTEYRDMEYGAEVPAAPQDGDFWLDSASGALSRYSASNKMWVELDSVYCKLSFAGLGQIPALFSAYDGVEISGAPIECLNGSKTIYALGGSAGSAPDYADAENDFVVLICEDARDMAQTQANISIRRPVPELDFVCQCQNRLWGCRYGNDGAGNINELYACALGDFKNWQQFMGLSTDSWRTAVGSDGVWTGAVGYLGSPVFFKEDCIHRVQISALGAHQVSETVSRGVQRGSHKSIQVLNDTLIYKSPGDVCLWQGGFSQGISQALGDRRYHSAAAGVLGQKYYISMADSEDGWHLFCYDAAKGLWMREDGLHAETFAEHGEELLCLSQGRLIALGGGMGEAEKDFGWYAESGILCCEDPGQKYISRLSLRLAMEQDAELEILVEYDSCGSWDFAGHIRAKKSGSVELPLPLRRCDHLRLRLQGRGGMKLFSVTREQRSYH